MPIRSRGAAGSSSGSRSRRCIRIRGVLVGLVVEVGRIRGGGGAGVLAEVVSHDLAGEVVDPGGKLALVAVGMAVFQDAVENDLHQVLADGRLVGQAHKKPVERAVVAFEEFTELPDFPGAHGNHEFMVVLGVHGGGQASR